VGDVGESLAASSAQELAMVIRLRTVHDSALAYLATTLRLANCSFKLRGLGWPHTKLLEYLGQAAPRREPGS
jgi:hypothetical protein